MVMPGRNKFCTPLVHADGPYLVGNAQRFQQGQICRQQGFTDMKTRMTGFFQQRYPMAPLREQSGSRRTRGAATDDQDITVRNKDCGSIMGGINGDRPAGGSCLIVSRQLPRSGVTDSRWLARQSELFGAILLKQVE